ncbi:MAG: hypothetical protein AAB392_02490 [Patescibacteria group bacterium]
MARNKNIKNPLDFMVEQARVETEIAKEIVESIRLRQDSAGQVKAGGDYYEEKIALKMLDFFIEEEKMLTLYAEAKQNYPIIAELMENKRPYLREFSNEAKKLFEKSLIEKI